MFLKKIFNKIRFIDKTVSLLLILITFILIIFFREQGNPDYGSYWKLFVNGDYYSSLSFGELSFFTFLTSKLNDFLNYELFRFIYAIFQIISFSFIFYKFKFRFSDISFFTCLPFLAFFLLKVHVQIRETLAILMWMFAIIDFNKKNFLNPRNFILFILSCLIHISVLFWWIPSFIYSIRQFPNKIKIFLNLLFFTIVGSYAGSTIFRLFIDDVRNNKGPKLLIREFVKLPEENILLIYTPQISFDTVEVNQFKLIYWFSYFFLILFIFLDEKRKKTNLIRFKLIENSTTFFGYIGLYGSLTFFSVSVFFSYFESLTVFGYNYIFRILFILLFLLSLYRNLESPKNIFTILLNSLMAFDIFRILFNIIHA